MMKKKILKMLLIGISLESIITINNYVYAAGIGWAPTAGVSITYGDEGPPSASTEEQAERIGNGLYYCNFEYGWQPQTNITINLYNMNGDSLVPSTISTLSNSYFPSGTWIGVNIEENRRADWSVDSDSYTYYETKKQYTCNYTKKVWEKVGTTTSTYSCPKEEYISKGTKSNDGTCKNICTKINSYERYSYNENNKACTCINEYTGKCSKTVDVEDWVTYETSYTKTVQYYDNSEYTCKSEYYDSKTNKTFYDSTMEINYPEVKISAYNDEIKKHCINKSNEITREKALGYVKTSISEVKYIKTNDYPQNEQGLPDEEKLSGSSYGNEGSILGKEDPNQKQSIVNEHSGFEVRVYKYTPGTICMNVKTADVTYGRDCNENELDVSGGSYWRYFIPLNTKSGSSFYLNLEKNSTVTNATLDEDECRYVIEHHPYSSDLYTNYIKDINGENFKGDYYKSNGKFNKNSLDNDAIKNGCIFSTKVNFNIVQEFYNEEKDDNGNLKFNGFNFYYRPVDITNPFPNTISTNSYWKGYWTDETKVNFNSSFDKKTYVTKLNITDVREDTVDIADASIQEDEETGILISGGSYSDWVNTMNKDGSSKFISKNTSIKREKKTTYYPLGCGPSNKNWIQCKKSGGNS